VTIPLAPALRAALRAGYGPADLRADLLAGAVVGTVALPLSMALAIASGVPPQHGLYTAIVAGALVALLGGSKVQVSGPTAAFVVILAPIASRFGLGGLLLATLIAGLLLIAMGLAGFGRLIEFVPHPVTTGFTAGIAVVIATLQVRDLLGLTVSRMPEHYLDRIETLAASLPSARWTDFAVGVLTLAIILAWPRFDRRAPAPLVALTVAAVGAFVATRVVPGFAVATINSRFSHAVAGIVVPGIPHSPPLFVLPWRLQGPEGAPLHLSFTLIRQLVPAAFAIAMLGAIESLLSAVVADGMTGGKHDPDAELVAQGVGNVVAPFFGGIAATGAIARTAANIRSGARSPFAAFFHAVFVLAAVLVLAPLLGYLPMASLAALLVIVAWNMSERKHFVRMLRIAPAADVVVLLTCFFLTIYFDMVVSVTAGIVISSLLFMKRMAEVSGVTLVGSGHPALDRPLPRGVLLYQVAGPLFFGAAEKAISTIAGMERRGVSVVVLDLMAVPAIDATGLVALESLIREMNDAGIKVILAGVQRQPLRAMARAGWRNRKGRLRIFQEFDHAIDVARRHVQDALAADATGPLSAGGSHPGA
jgi:SulP family sulfate permease